MKDYLYDGTFEGFLTCIHAHYYHEKASGIYRSDQYQASMLSDPIEMITDHEKASLVYDAIRSKISDFDLKRVYRVFLSSVDDKETKLLKYIILGFRMGYATSSLHGNPIVYDVQEAEIKVSREINRLSGLIRFSALGNHVLYSPIEPDHDVIEFLADHFADRLKNESFVIHDLRRNKAVISSNGHWVMTQFTDEDLPELSSGEEDFRRLWKMYFETIAIKERTNPRCQKTLMPVRYWKNLTEMK